MPETERAKITFEQYVAQGAFENSKKIKNGFRDGCEASEELVHDGNHQNLEEIRLQSNEEHDAALCKRIRIHQFLHRITRPFRDQSKKRFP